MKMNASTQSTTQQTHTVTKHFEIRLDAGVVNAYKNRLRQRQHQQQHKKQCHCCQVTRIKRTSVEIVGDKNRRTSRWRQNETTNAVSKSSVQVRNNTASNAVARKKLDTVANRKDSSAPTQPSFHRHINDCFNELVKLNEQHVQAKINLKAEYDFKLDLLKRDYGRRVDEIKQKFFQNTGF